MKGLAVQVNSTLDAETVKLVGEEYGVDVLDIEESVEDSAKKSRDFIDEDDIDNLQSRPPVVTPSCWSEVCCVSRKRTRSKAAWSARTTCWRSITAL